MPHKWVQIAVGTIAVIFAALLLIVAVIVLYFAPTQDRRLGGILGFTALFALCVSLLTNAKSHEIFAAASAYVTVLLSQKSRLRLTMVQICCCVARLRQRRLRTT